MNVLLVDDQEKILEATKKLVDWEKLGIREVYTANNATAAREVLGKNEIDIVLVDIEMPGENGIELQGWIHEEYPDIACIFLTSHADFQYAQEAIRNGAYDYILQPASFSEIERVVGKCITSLETKRQMIKKSNQYDESQEGILKNHVFAMFHQKEQYTAMDIWKKDSGTEDGNWWYLPCLINVFAAQSHDSESQFMTEMKKAGICNEEVFGVPGRLNDHEFACIFYGKNAVPDISVMKQRLWFICQELGDSHHFDLNLYIGQYAKDDLPKQIGKIVEFKANHILKRNQVYMVEDMIPQEIRKPDSGIWSRWLIRRDMALLKNQIINLLRFAEQEQYLTISYMQMLIHSFLEACSIACYEQKQNLSDLFDESFTYEQMLNSWTSVDELRKSVDKVLHRYTGMLVGDGEELSFSAQERVQEIIHYLEENMDRMISRREAAKYVFLNEDYFSRIFRKETGLGYKEYVLKQKVDYAEKLLKNTDMPVVMVASKVGYENYTNFTQMFRKVTGITPTDYRKKYQNEEK